MPRIHRVLLSVTDKTGLLEFARQLIEVGAELISTGGTARLIREAGRVPVERDTLYRPVVRTEDSFTVAV